MVFGLGRLFLWSSFLVLFVLNVGVVVVAVDAGGEDNDDEDTFDDLDELIDEFYEVQLKILDHIESQHAHSGLHNGAFIFFIWGGGSTSTVMTNCGFLSYPSYTNSNGLFFFLFRFIFRYYRASQYTAPKDEGSQIQRDE